MITCGYDCCNNNLTTLPPLHSKITELHCSNNRLTTLPKQLPNSLKYINCSRNYLTSIPHTFQKGTYNEHNPFLFNYIHYNKWFNYNERISWKNYKTLVTVQKRSKRAPERHRGLWVHSVDFQKRSEGAPKESLDSSFLLAQIFQKSKKNVISTYFCRDIIRMCNAY